MFKVSFFVLNMQQDYIFKLKEIVFKENLYTLKYINNKKNLKKIKIKNT